MTDTVPSTPLVLIPATLLTHKEPVDAMRALTTFGSDITGPLSTQEIAIFLDLAHKWGFDPHYVLDGYESDDSSRNSNTIPDEETLLEWLTVHRPSGNALGHDTLWPLDVAGFEAMELLTTPPKHNHEWFMSLMVAHGTTPWGSPRPPKQVLKNIFERGHWTLLVQLLRLPDALTLREVLSMPCPFGDKGSTDTYGKWLSAGRADPKTWKFFIDTFPDFTPTPAELAVASPENVVALEKFFPRQGQQWDEIHKKWDERLDSNKMDPTQHAKMLSVIHGDTHQQRFDRKNQSVIDWALVRGKGELPWGRWSYSQQEEGDEVGLLSLYTSKELPGEWSVLSALIFNYIADTDNLDYGCWLLSWKDFVLVAQKDRNGFLSHHEGSLDQKKGILAPVLEHCSIEGIRNKGMLALLLLGRKIESSNDRNEETNYRIGVNKIASKGLSNASKVFNIKNWRHFADQSLLDAVKFSEWFVNLNPNKAKPALLIAWTQALIRYPTWFKSHPELLSRLLDTLCLPPHLLFWEKDDENQPVWNDTRDPNAKFLYVLCSNLRGEQDEDTFDFSLLEASLRPAMAKVLLAMCLPTPLQRVALAIEAILVDEPTLGFIEEWIARMRTTINEGSSQSRDDHVLLGLEDIATLERSLLAYRSKSGHGGGVPIRL